MKICPACEEPAGANVKFCPKCGGALPEQTVAQGTVCSSCGKQNSIGTKFCADCAAKLPAAIAEEEAAKRKDEIVLSNWDTTLPTFPKWCYGGYDLRLELCSTDANGNPYYAFNVNGVGMAELGQYKQLLKQNGFRPAGQYPSESQLFKRVNGVVYNFDSEDPFSGGSNCIGVGFAVREPIGGFDYVEAPKPKGIKGLFGF